MRLLMACAALLAAAQGNDVDAAARAAIDLAWTGTREITVPLAHGDVQPLRIAVGANETLFVRAESAQLDLALDVRDGSERYASNSPAAVAGIEYLVLPAQAGARIVAVDLHPEANEGATGEATLRLLAGDDPHAAIAGDWAQLSRGFERNDESQQTRERLIKLDALLARCDAAEDTRCAADAQLARADVLTTLTRADEAQPAYEAAIARYQTLGASLGEGHARMSGAARLYYRGEMAQAEAVYRQCSEIAKAAGLTFRQGEYETAVAVMRHYAGDLDAALVHYERARELMGDLRVANVVHLRSNIGGVYEQRGEPMQARAAFQDAIDFAGDAPELEYARASAMSNLGALLADLGEKQTAIDLLNDSVETFRKVNAPDDEARVLSILAFQYAGLRRYALAESLLKRSLVLCEKQESRACLAAGNRHLGHVAWQQGRLEEAEALMRTALEQSEANEDPHRVFLVVRQFASLLLDRGKPGDALALLDRAERRWKVESMPAAKVLLLLQRGRALIATGQPDAARRVFETLVETQAALASDSATVAGAQLELARLDAADGAWGAVETRAAAEVERIGAMRREFLGSDTRAEFLATQQEIFELLIRARLARHRAGDATALAEAFDTEERARSRALLDALSDADSAHSPANEARAAARSALRIKSLALDRLAARATDADAEKLEKLRADVALARVELEAIETRDIALQQGRALGVVRSLGDTQAMLGANDALLLFRASQRAAWVWVVTRDDARVVDLPDAGIVAPRVVRYVQDVREGGRDPEGDARWLHDTLIGGLKLPANIARLAIVPDGALHGLPFAALVTPDERYLVEAVEIAQVPSASVALALGQGRRSRPDDASTDVVVFADPVFTRDDPRLRAPTTEASAVGSGAMPDLGVGGLLSQELLRSGDDIDALPRLPGTAREAAAIAAAFGNDRVRVFSGFDATLEAAQSEIARQARILHFATHGIVDPTAPELTGLALSRWRADGTAANDEGFLDLARIGDGRFQADLVVLSACDSAIGQHIESEGLMGIARAFLAAGAGSVVATLWPVADHAAATLEGDFAQTLQQGQSAPAALAAAQRAAIADPERRQPRNWAAFGYYGSY